MAIYTSGGGGCNGVTNLYAFNEDSGVLGSAISTNLTAGTDYYIVVWVGKVETATNDLFLELKLTRPTAPANGSCAGAIVIPSNASLPYNTPVVDTTLAATDTNLVPSCAVPFADRRPSRQVWFSYRPAVAGTYIFSTKNGDTATTIEDTMIAIYTTDNGCNGPLTEVTCNDNGVGRAIVARPLATNITYYIVAWDNSRDYIPGETDLQLRVSPATAPTVTTLPALSLASTGAVLGGIVNANGLQSRFWFEWGPTTGLGSTSQTRLIFANIATPFTTNLAVTGFQPNVLYHYRFTSSNTIGLVKGDDLTFVYSNARPFMVEPTRLDNGKFLFQFEANPPQLYLVQGSTNLLDWADLGLATNVSSTLFQYLHEHGGLDATRFYRVKLQ
jgi:hypothetical protein